MLFPFKGERPQQFVSMGIIVVGALLMVMQPLFALSDGVVVNGFMAGLLLFFIGFLYFLDV